MVPNKLLALLCSCFIYFTLGGCAAPGVGLDPTKTNIDSYLGSLPATPADKSRAIIYRDSGFNGGAVGMNLSIDGATAITIANKKFESILVNPGPKEVKISVVVPGNPTCTKTLFIASNQLSYIKIGERSEYNKVLANLLPLVSLLVENSAESASRCGGPWEPFLVRETEALKEIRELR